MTRLKYSLAIILIVSVCLSAFIIIGCQKLEASEPSVSVTESSLNAYLQYNAGLKNENVKLRANYALLGSSYNATLLDLQHTRESLAAASSQVESLKDDRAELQKQVAAMSGQMGAYANIEADYNKLFGQYADLQARYERIYELRPLADWSTVAELEAFLAGDDSDSSIEVTGNITLSMIDCEDFAVTLRGHAACIGKNIEVILCTRSQFSQWFGRALVGPGGNWHALNMALIGNEIHVIDQLSDEHRHVLDLD